MNFIVVDYDPFAVESRLYVVKEQRPHGFGVYSEIEKLSKEIERYAEEYNISEVRIHAPQAIIEEIKSRISDKIETVERI